MLCGKCKKNQATKTYEQIKNGKKETSYYCLDCYHKSFVCVEEATGEALSACPYCGMEAAQFKRTKIVGCAYCYQTLAHVVFPVVTKMQGGEIHKGKRAYETQTERTERRIHELETMAEKCYSENDDKSAGRYEEHIDQLRAGKKENLVWHNQLLSKRS